MGAHIFAESDRYGKVSEYAEYKKTKGRAHFYVTSVY